MWSGIPIAQSGSLENCTPMLRIFGKQILKKSCGLVMVVNVLGINNLPVACDTHSGLERTGVVGFLWRQDPGGRRGPLTVSKNLYMPCQRWPDQVQLARRRRRYPDGWVPLCQEMLDCPCITSRMSSPAVQTSHPQNPVGPLERKGLGGSSHLTPPGTPSFLGLHQAS